MLSSNLFLHLEWMCKTNEPVRSSPGCVFTACAYWNLVREQPFSYVVIVFVLWHRRVESYQIKFKTKIETLVRNI